MTEDTAGIDLAVVLTSLVLCATVALFVCRILPWLRRRRRLITMSARLPGAPFADGEHPHPWLFDVGTILKLPTAPGRPAIRVMMPWWEEMARMYCGGGGSDSQKGVSEDDIGGDYGLIRVWAFSPFRVPFARCIVQIFDPDLAADVLGPRCYGLFDKGRLYGVARPLVGDSLLALADGPEWKAQRKLAAPGFGHFVLERTAAIVGRLLEEEVFPRWDDPASRDGFDVMKYMCPLTLDVLCEAAFSYSFGGVKSIDPGAMMSDTTVEGAGKVTRDKSTPSEGSVYRDYETIKETLTVRARSPPLREWLPLEENRRCRAASDNLNAAIEEIIGARLLEQKNEERPSSSPDGKARRGGGEKKRDLLAQLLLKDESGARLSRRQILGNVRMFLFAGHDTTAASLSYAVWHLAKRPDVQARLYAEVAPLFRPRRGDDNVESVGGGDDNVESVGGGGDTSAAAGGPTYAELRNLPYLDAVVRETLRLHAPAGAARQALRDVTIGGRTPGQKEYVIPEGCEVYVFPWLVHRHPRTVGGGASEFEPERWMLPKSGGEAGRGEDSSGACRGYMPFSVGPRSCVGQQLALAEMRSFLARVVCRYTFEPAEGAAEPVPLLTMTVSPHEVMVRFRKRQDQ